MLKTNVNYARQVMLLYAAMITHNLILLLKATSIRIAEKNMGIITPLRLNGTER